MARFCTFLAFCALVSVALTHEIQVLYSPESIVLQNTSQPLLSSDYSKFVALCLGYSSEKPSNGFCGFLKRSTRQTRATKPDHNLAHAYAADFHVAFTTIGFTTVLLLLTVFGVSVAMWNIDPGRDSIIYRLTSQKMKKDQ